MQPPAPAAKPKPQGQQQQQQQQQGKRPWVKRKRGADLSPMERLQHAVGGSGVLCMPHLVLVFDARWFPSTLHRFHRSTDLWIYILLRMQQATKEIGRELKRVKAFLLQRLVKRCRKLRGQGNKGKGPVGSKEEEGEGENSDSSRCVG